MNIHLLKILEEETAKEKAKKKKKLIFKVRKEKSVMYYSGWGKDKPIKEKKTERHHKHLKTHLCLFPPYYFCS